MRTMELYGLYTWVVVVGGGEGAGTRAQQQQQQLAEAQSTVHCHSYIRGLVPQTSQYGRAAPIPTHAQEALTHPEAQ